MNRCRFVLLSAVLVSATPAPAATPEGPGHCPGRARVRVEVPVVPLPGFTAEVRVDFGGRIHHGRVIVEAGGRIHLEHLGDRAAERWCREQLAAALARRNPAPVGPGGLGWDTRVVCPGGREVGHTWARVGPIDLPAAVGVTTAGGLTLTRHRLLELGR
jgi:hypothetical protein